MNLIADRVSGKEELDVTIQKESAKKPNTKTRTTKNYSTTQ